MRLYDAFQISLLDVTLRCLFYTDVDRRLKILICDRHVILLQLETKNFCITIPNSPIQLRRVGPHWDNRMRKGEEVEMRNGS